MKLLWGAMLLGVSALAAGSVSDLPDGVQRWTAAELKTRSAALKQKAASDANRTASEKIIEYPNEYFMMAHREKDGVPEFHETQADIFVVQSGTATLLVGGELENAETISPGEKRNGTIKGGAKTVLNAGDIVRIPAKTPHQLLVSSAPFDYFVIKVKGY